MTATATISCSHAMGIHVRGKGGHERGQGRTLRVQKASDSKEDMSAARGERSEVIMYKIHKEIQAHYLPSRGYRTYDKYR